MSNNSVPFIKERLEKVSTILVSLPEPPSSEKSPYYELSKKYGVKVDFKPFIEVQPVSAKEFRKQKINILDHSAVIFTSRNSVMHFFAICKENKIEVPTDMKYFCVSEQTSNYLQKFIVVRKRKIFTGEKNIEDLYPLLKKHKNEKILFPCSNIRKDDLPKFLQENSFEFTEMTLYKTVAIDLSDLKNVNYDIIAFYSPSGVSSLLENFPGFKQNNTRIATFGSTTSKAVKDAGLIVDIEAPLPGVPSMTGALENYIKLANKGK